MTGELTCDKNIKMLVEQNILFTTNIPQTKKEFRSDNNSDNLFNLFRLYLGIKFDFELIWHILQKTVQ